MISEMKTRTSEEYEQNSRRGGSVSGSSAETEFGGRAEKADNK